MHDPNPSTHRLLPSLEQLERLRLAAEATIPPDKNIRSMNDVVLEATPTRFSVYGATVLAGGGGGLVASSVVFVALLKWWPSRRFTSSYST